MVQKNLLGTAIAIAAEAFRDKVDKAGEPYMFHCIRVMMKQTTIKRKILAILHDVPEDTNVTFDDLIASGFGMDIIIPLKLLTHDHSEKTYEDYIRDISTNEDATAVKLADLEDNSQITRLKGLTKADFARMEKYHKSYTYLSKL